MLTTTLKQIFERDLSRVMNEVAQYQSEDRLWITDKGISNSAGNLCLHLVGGLNHFIGKVIGGTDYVRDRPLEFSRKGVPAAELNRMLADTKVVVAQALDKLSAADLEQEYPLLVLEEKTSTEFFLVHLAAHLSYHLGQINYHRRMLDA